MVVVLHLCWLYVDPLAVWHVYVRIWGTGSLILELAARAGGGGEGGGGGRLHVSVPFRAQSP